MKVILAQVSQMRRAILATFNSLNMTVTTLPHFCVIGAGPAGIAAIGKLLDNGVTDITWIDPRFEVGMVGLKWSTVSSNTSVKLFEAFLEACPSFKYQRNDKYELHKIEKHLTCKLALVVPPLQEVTENLKKQVKTIHGHVFSARRQSDGFFLDLGNGEGVQVDRLVLAIGSEPRHIENIENIIPLEIALQVDLLKQNITKDDTVAVFGSSHSAIMILRDLLESTDVKAVVNFFRSPLLFAESLPDGRFINDSTGLKGKTALWARNNLLGGDLPAKLTRYETREADRHTFNKSIFAIGFNRVKFDLDGTDLKHDPRSGVIADHVYGCGIAFPELRVDANGKHEESVGMWKFMVYLDRVVPNWIL